MYVNYQLPNDRKPETVRNYKYSEFLKEHISIIDPKILILMGSTAMEAAIARVAIIKYSKKEENGKK